MGDEILHVIIWREKLEGANLFAVGERGFNFDQARFVRLNCVGLPRGRVVALIDFSGLELFLGNSVGRSAFRGGRRGEVIAVAYRKAKLFDSATGADGILGHALSGHC